MGLRGFGLRSHPYDDVTEPDADAGSARAV